MGKLQNPRVQYLPDTQLWGIVSRELRRLDPLDPNYVHSSAERHQAAENARHAWNELRMRGKQLELPLRG
jgi:hypothetical protein